MIKYALVKVLNLLVAMNQKVIKYSFIRDGISASYIEAEVVYMFTNIVQKMCSNINKLLLLFKSKRNIIDYIVNGFIL